MLAAISAAGALAYDPPKGIPDPAASFSTFGEIDRATPGWPASWLTPTTTATAGYYFIDNSDPAAEDAGSPTNTYGHPDRPRLSFPSSTSLPAGTYIYVHGGTYTSANIEDLRGVGTAANPIWITGNAAAKPSVQRLMHIGRGATGTTSYMVLENFALSSANGTIQIRPTVNGVDIDHVLIRNCTITQTQTSADAGGLSVSFSTTNTTLTSVTAEADDDIFTKTSHGIFANGGVIFNSGTGFTGITAGTTYFARDITANTFKLAATSGGAAIDITLDGTSGSFSVEPFPDTTVTDIVVYNNVISNIGVRSGVGTTDSAGVYNGLRTARVWVLDNDIHNIAADSVAGSHYANYTTKTAEYYYIGRNLCYGNGENAIDIKAINYFVISENTTYGPWLRDQGGSIIPHYGADTDFHCRNGAIIFNRVYHDSVGIGTGSSGVDDLIVIGNLFYDIHASYAVVADPLNGSCISSTGTVAGGNSAQYFVDNVFYDYDRGIYIEPNVGDAFKIHGNIFSQRAAGPALYDVQIPTNGREAYVDMDYNFYHNSTDRFFWANALRDLAYMQGTASEEAHAVNNDPLFTDAAAGTFTLQAGSPAIGANVEGPVGDTAYDAFFATFGIAIEKDFAGLARPQGGSWDIGAYEYTAGGGGAGSLTITGAFNITGP